MNAHNANPQENVTGNAMKTLELTERLAEWATDSRIEFTSSALSRAADAVQDTIGCIVAGAGDTGATQVRNALRIYGDGAASVIGAPTIAGGAGTASPWAAFANATAAHALDFDDNFLPGINHASAVLVPALIALGQERGTSGQALLGAYVVGLELQAVLGRGFGRHHYDVGWHNTSTIGTVGAAGACARLLGLSSTQTLHALSLGVSMACGPKVQFGSPAKPMHAGVAAHHAVLAATLAEHGVSGRPDAIEGERGMIALFAAEPTTDWDAILANLGAPLAIDEYGLSPKLYPCCGSAHRILDGVLALQDRHGVQPTDISRVDALIGYGNKRNLCYDRPEQEMEARFSLPYCVAVALSSKRLALGDFTPKAVHRDHIRDLLPLTEMRAMAPDAEGADPTARLPHITTMHLKGGDVLTMEVLSPRGAIDNPFSDADKAQKFTDCCEGFIDSDRLADLSQALGHLTGVEDINTLTPLMAFDAGPGDRGERFERRHHA
ncbi:MAG: MmgE/PrpD family protein [Pseudomonadota bacterium]